ncbi:hypothetical protein SO802_025676 [Lithocarpus litseifolius]|uniref:Uncharacterized protein n=1 Tax=Lithocarpus litseifolius TaxID=425828 RepID=A0AAW2BXH1_9ROSI
MDGGDMMMIMIVVMLMLMLVVMVMVVIARLSNAREFRESTILEIEKRRKGFEAKYGRMEGLIENRFGKRVDSKVPSVGQSIRDTNIYGKNAISKYSCRIRHIYENEFCVGGGHRYPSSEPNANHGSTTAHDPHTSTTKADRAFNAVASMPI